MSMHVGNGASFTAYNLFSTIKMSRTPKTMVITAQHLRTRARAPNAHWRNRFNQNRCSEMLFHLVTRRVVDNRTADPRSGRRPQLLTAQRPHHWEFPLVSSCLHLLYYSHFYKFTSFLDLTNVLSKWSHRPTSESQESQQILSGRRKGM